MGWWLAAFGLLGLVLQASGEALTPPYFNLALGRKISATATCGEGVPEPEQYCKLVGANIDNEKNVDIIHGQVCDICDPTREDKKHPAEYAIDSTEAWWQSPPLSRNMRLNKVNVTIDFGQPFHVAYVVITMANSPRPGVWVLEKSMDYGQTFKPWQYFADSDADCENFFGKESLQPITRDDSVICTTDFSKLVPLEGGEIIVRLLSKRPSEKNFFNSTILQDFTRATNVRLRLLRTKTFDALLMSVKRQDHTVTRRYYYSIKDISIGGRCMCNGHANNCHNTDPIDPYKLVCACQHNTCGDECDTCCPGFRQKAWRIRRTNDPFVCEECNCYGHSDSCDYSEEADRQHLSVDIHGQYIGGGVCKDCRHNTRGINCNECQPKYFRPYNKPLNATDVCKRCDCDTFYSTGNCTDGDGKCECRPEFQGPDCDSCSYGHFGYPDCRPCDCLPNGTRGNYCDSKGGACPCLPNFGGKYCRECAQKFYNFPDCLPCDCNEIGSLSPVCNVESGNCTCKNNFGSRSCGACANGYYNYPDCTYCSCDTHGTVTEVCDKSDGKCICKEGYGGERCDQCLPGYFGYPDCRPCNCENGSSSKVCDANGKCPCTHSYAGHKCNSCSPGFYDYPSCIDCNCDESGSVGRSCDADGICQCKPNFEGEKCSSCKSGFYNFPACEECNCHPAGTSAGFQGCGSVPPGELCQCKPRVHGRICDQCRPLFWNLASLNPEGCSECNCHSSGVLGGIKECDLKSGQCVCKPGVESARCDTCRNEYYQLQEYNLFGCRPCNCDIGGAEDNLCDKGSGQCQCHPRVGGRDCREPLQAHYFPTLYSQLQFEMEDGYTPGNQPARYDFDEKQFPDYSWKGYAVFSHLQNELHQEVFISKPSGYRMVIRYVNPTATAATGVIKLSLIDSKEDQSFPVNLPPTTTPSLITIPGPWVVDTPSNWDVGISLKGAAYLDYFVLLPAAFYEAIILDKRVEAPCTGNSSLSVCRHFNYPVLPFKTSSSFHITEDALPPRELYQDTEHLKTLTDAADVPLLSASQPVLSLELQVDSPDKYILVVSYVTPIGEQKSFPVDVEVQPSQSPELGRLQLPPCPYDMPCRQAVVDAEGRINTYFLPDPFTFVHFKTSREWDPKIGFLNVTAIPVDQWNLDYIRPSPVCIKKDGQCIPTTFPYELYSTKIEFESALPDLTVAEVPSYVSDNGTSLVLVGDRAGNITINGTAPAPGYYVIVLHYFQPYYPKLKVPVTVENRDQNVNAEWDIAHCPGNGGCRTPLIPTAGDTQGFYLVDNFTLNFKTPENKDLFLDYILLSNVNSANILEEELLDESGLFIQECGQNHFHIDTKTEGFCRDAVFSLTMDHYKGALRCECSYEGSLEFKCATFGGQCRCKPNIIGRRCEICKSGYFGYPNCRPCNCPSGVCDQISGECVCPGNVRGDLCDKCVEQTYGYDRIHGCIRCDCDPQGVANGNMECDSDLGTCSCKVNVVGRQCQDCQAGYWNFPRCQECACDLRGTTDEICSQSNSQCICKPNVYGSACDLCKEGTFHISETNPKGCTQCFCFGKTTRCSSSNLYVSQIGGLEGWELVTLDKRKGRVKIAKILDPPDLLQDGQDPELGADFSINDVGDSAAYFAAAEPFSGNKITSYGGNLSYTIFSTRGDDGNDEGLIDADVILQGADTYLMYSSFEQPVASEPFQVTISLVENNFRSTSGLSATREQIMQVLQSLSKIYIRANYWKRSITTRLSKVTLDIATTAFHPDAEHALSVEQCQCPPNYQGLSCEECAPGFYRTQTGPYGGYCAPCQCNGHSESCDPVTGKCFDCKHNTHGDYCELCEEGYQGNATYGTPFDCLICACPLPMPSNNFATSCDLSEDGEHISCDCKTGYYGARCESCAAGFFGQPLLINSTCQPCNCSGNINPTDPDSCDSISGKCLKCMHNTAGDACNYCAPFYHGDAVLLKDCKDCDCVRCGTHNCESYTGQCVCHDNVIGETCDRCAPNHWGFKSCQGCRPCDCSIASIRDVCDDDSGQCACQPGVVGRTCERCAPGFWNYTAEGCVSCGCNSEFSIGVGCNPLTGQCECLPGVIGERCDHCPHRWVLKPDEGCFECDTCSHDLLDTTDSIKGIIDEMNAGLGSFAGGYLTNQRLKHINDTTEGLLGQVSLLDADKFDLSPVVIPVQKLEEDARTSLRQIQFIAERTGEKAAESEIVRVQSLDLEDLARLASDKAGNTVYEVGDLADSLDRNSGPHVDEAVVEAEQILENLKTKSFESYNQRAENERTNATEVKETMKEFSLDVLDQEGKVNEQIDSINDFHDVLDDFRNLTTQAKLTAYSTIALIDSLRGARLVNKAETVQTLTDETNKAIGESRELQAKAYEANTEARAASYEVVREKGRRMDSRDNLNMSLIEQSEELANLEEPVRLSKIHAEDLERSAQTLSDSFAETRDVSGHGVLAASAYSDIEKAISASRKAAEDAQVAADSADSKSDGLGKKARDSLLESSRLLNAARNATSLVLEDLRSQLDAAKERVDAINDRTTTAQEIFKKNEKEVERTNAIKSLEVASARAISDSDAANATTLAKIADIAVIIDKMPTEVEAARQLPKDVGAIKFEISQAKNELDRVNNILPDINRLMDNLTGSHQRLEASGKNVDDLISRLKRQVAEARDIASRIRVGVTFQPNTFIQIKNPEDITSQSTSTKVSGYFKTQKDNGALLYIGNEIGTSRKVKRTLTDDFLAVEIENWYPTVVMDLGDGYHRINSDFKVEIDTWYQFIVERTGKHVKFTIREEKPNGQDVLHTKEEIIRGHASILNLDPEETKIYVGGTPQSARIQPAVRYNSFFGQMEDLVIGGTPISLWNFKNAENNRGALDRDRLLNKNQNTGYRFHGDGYAALNSSSYRLDARTSVILRFKTAAPDGLIFLVGRGTSFLSLELDDGFLIYKYRVDNNLYRLSSNERLTDDKWHSIEGARAGNQGLLKLDDIQESSTSDPPNPESLLEVTDIMYFGGHPGNHGFPDASSIGFDGCIDGVVVDGTSVDLSKHITSFGVTGGCPPKFAGTVSFSEPGFILWPNVTATDGIDLSLRFKTSQAESLLLLVTTRAGTDPFSIAIYDGDLVVKSNGAQLVTSSAKWNDGEWHVVTVTHVDGSMKLSIDDFEIVSDQSSSPEKLRFAELLVGGLPSNVPPNFGKYATAENFKGCIADVAFNGVLVNFANATKSSNAIVGKCSDGETVLNQREPKVVRPTTTTTTTTTTTSTTTPRPQTLPTVAPPASLCQLPLRPPSDNGDPLVDGYRFGTSNNSRLEFGKLHQKTDKRHYRISLFFKTSYPDGIILYAFSKRADRIGIFMREGLIHFTFNMGSGEGLLTGKERYDDGAWHEVEIATDNNKGHLTVDKILAAEGESPGNTKDLNLMSPLFVGGLSPEAQEMANIHLQIRQGFEGCIKDIRMNGRPIPPPNSIVGVVPCSQHTEPGVFFHADGGHVRLAENFRVGTSIDIKLMIRPRYVSGVILSVHGKRDYLLLQMVDGAIIFRVDNGQGAITSTFAPPADNKYYFCNGEWHSVHAVQAKNVIALTVDAVAAESAVGTPGSSATDTKHPLILGGSRIRGRPGVSQEQFVGCIKDVVINKKPYKIDVAKARGNVTVSACPTN